MIPFGVREMTAVGSVPESKAGKENRLGHGYLPFSFFAYNTSIPISDFPDPVCLLWVRQHPPSHL